MFLYLYKSLSYCFVPQEMELNRYMICFLQPEQLQIIYDIGQTL